MASQDHAHTASAGLEADGYCELCGEPCDADPAVWDTAGFDICTNCLEGLLDASTYSPRAEVGLVGGGY